MAKVKKVSGVLSQAQLNIEYKKRKKAYNERVRYWENKSGLDLSDLKITKTPKRVTTGSIEKLTKRDKNYFEKQIKKKKKAQSKKQQKAPKEKKVPQQKPIKQPIEKSKIFRRELPTKEDGAIKKLIDWKKIYKAYRERLRYYENQGLDISFLKEKKPPKKITQKLIEEYRGRTGEWIKHKVELNEKKKRKSTNIDIDFEYSNVIFDNILEIIRTYFIEASTEYPWRSNVYNENANRLIKHIEGIRNTTKGITEAQNYEENAETINVELERGVYAYGPDREKVLIDVENKTYLMIKGAPMSLEDNIRMTSGSGYDEMQYLD